MVNSLTVVASREAEFNLRLEAVRSRAHSLALQLTRNQPDAEDLVQDSIVKAWRAYDSYQSDRPFLNWLLRIVHRTFLDSRRRLNPIRRAESLHSMVSPTDGEHQELPIADDGPTPEEELFHREWTTQLHLAIAELPEVYRSAIEMCDFEEMTYSEIADAQDTTIGTVRSRIHRGRKMLREIIQRKGIQVP